MGTKNDYIIIIIVTLSVIIITISKNVLIFLSAQVRDRTTQRSPSFSPLLSVPFVRMDHFRSQVLTRTDPRNAFITYLARKSHARMRRICIFSRRNEREVNATRIPRRFRARYELLVDARAYR